MIVQRFFNTDFLSIYFSCSVVYKVVGLVFMVQWKVKGVEKTISGIGVSSFWTGVGVYKDYVDMYYWGCFREGFHRPYPMMDKFKVDRIN